MNQAHHSASPSLLFRLHLDGPLLVLLLLVTGLGLFILYSASGQDPALMQRQLIRIGMAWGAMFVIAQIPPGFWAKIAPLAYLIGVLLLIAVLLAGTVGKGAQRWLDLGFMQFQPSEIMKLVMPMIIARYIASHNLPPSLLHVGIGMALVLVPTLLIARQPDLGTAILIAASGLFVLFLAGLSWKIILSGAAAGLVFMPILWLFLMQDYQKQRVLTFLNPEADPLGAGYHIIQSKIAIGSGGWDGKGWLQGTQSQLDFLPERHTDFIFSVFSEEFGFQGALLLLLLYSLIILRGLWIAHRSQYAFTKLLAGSITLTFFVYVFVNIGMVSGLLPVVGVPLPLVSYGGTSMVTLMSGFGMLMAIATQKRLINRET